LTTYLIWVISLPVCIAFGAVGRWIYFHPERLLKIFYGELVQKPYSNFSLGIGKVFGVLLLFIGTWGVTSQLLLLFFRALRIPGMLALVAITSLAALGTLYLIKHTSSHRATEKQS
jgi:hypothetical protein